MPTARKASRKTAQRPPTGPRKIDLALQGGGSHGAFTWGVLDAVLADGRLVPEGISGTSAGAMNAAVLATGFARGGASGAREALAAFWSALGGISIGFSGPTAPINPLMANRDLWPGYDMLESWLRMWSPYQTNPLNLDPLRALVERHVDIPALSEGPLKLFVTATSVRTGQPRVFEGRDLSVDALMASACLPQSSQAVVIDGEPYWDGGFAGNPAIWPLVYGTRTDDVLLVQLNPLVHHGVPHTAAEIADRVNEITFNASLVAEMRAISFVQKLLGQRRLDPTHYKQLRLHRVADEEGLAPYDASSKLNTDPRLLRTLFDLGHNAGQRWLAQHADAVGHHGTLDIDKTFLMPRGV
jgi:NTE family protein